jgi:hypothetical protein
LKNPKNFDIIDNMKQWEYIVIDMKAEINKVIKAGESSNKVKKMTGAEMLQKCMNDFGKDGWEFCIAQDPNFLFKRSKDEDVEFKVGPLFEKKL